MKNFLSLLLIILLYAIDLSAQKPSNILDKQIKIKPATYKLQEVFDILINDYNVNITYDANTLPMDKSISVTKFESTIKLLFEKLKKNYPITYQVEGQYIIVKKKNLEEKYKISGVVIDSVTSESMPGTTIIIDNTNRGVTSDVNGFFSMKLEPGTHKLSFKFIGYKQVEKVLELYDDIELDAYLSPEVESIQEVKITKQRNFWGKMDVGRNISTIDNKKVQLLNTNNATDLLQARVPGVWSSQISGAPGDHQKVRVRGLSSLFACSDPLYVIDGVAVPIVNLHSLGIGDLNVFDIEKVTVLKDAASTAIYGFQGANGVIIIDTKRSNTSKISFSTKYGVQSMKKRYDLMNTKDFLAGMDTVKRFGFNVRKFYPAYSDTLTSTDWQDKVFTNGTINEYQLTCSGSLLNSNVYLSGNYYRHEGIVRNSNFKRYNLMANVGKNISKRLSAEIMYRGSIQKNFNNIDQYLGNDLIINGINKSPLLYSTPDTFYKDPPKTPPPGFTGTFYTNENPQRTYFRDSKSRSIFGDSIPTEWIIDSTKNGLNISSSAINLSLKLLLSNNIFINASSSVTFRSNKYVSENIDYPSNFPIKVVRLFFTSHENYVLLNQQINFNYSKKTGDHEVLALAGFKNYADNANWKLDKKTRGDDVFLRNSLVMLDKSGAVTRYINTFATHLNYNYKKKYTLSLIANYEHLEVKRAIRVWELFPSIALNWDISREPGFNKLSWLNQFNIFANWGKVGNYPVNGIANNSYKDLGYSFNNVSDTGKAVTRFANHFLKSEISEEYNLGSNIKLFNSRLFISADYYSKENANLIILRDIPFYYMGGKMMYNIGKIENKGYEISIEVTPVNNSNFYWTSTFSVFYMQQRVTDLGNDDNSMIISSEVSIPSFSLIKNQSLGNIMGYKYMGVWDKDNNKNVINIDGYKYYNPDTPYTVLNDMDKVIIGKSIPDYIWHWTNSFQYRNITVDFLWYGVRGVDKFNSTRAATYMAGTNREINKILKPRINPLSKKYFYQSSYFVEDASFIKLKQISISYLISRKILKFADITLSLSFDNILTFTKYSGYDPEASIYTDNSFSDFAVDRGAYPNPKSVYFTIKLDL